MHAPLASPFALLALGALCRLGRLHSVSQLSATARTAVPAFLSVQRWRESSALQGSSVLSAPNAALRGTTAPRSHGRCQSVRGAAAARPNEPTSTVVQRQ